MTNATALIVIPTLNEAAHIGQLLQSLLPSARRLGARIVVVDGGSDDKTVEIAGQQAASAAGLIDIIHNPLRLQSAAVNLAVSRFGEDADWLIRVDAHSAYPADFCDILLADAARTGADSVVVAMTAVGRGGLQAAIADAQNSRLGNGGSPHRLRGQGAWVDHGHHALIRISAFRDVGGYDESFSHNEDAELDHRLRQAGYRIWLTAATGIEYFPRSGLSALARQYYRFGRGRARNLLKHGLRPAPRQLLVALLGPAVALTVLMPLSGWFGLPLLLWLAGCLGGGLSIAVRQRSLRGIIAGFAAGIMHLSWSFGFWRQWLALRAMPGAGR